MFKEIGSVFSFLTIIPLNNSNLETIAKNMHFFPLAGIVIGIVVGSIGYGLSFFLDPLITSLLVVISLVIITGLHHIDGLADFADGLMAKGSKEKKLLAMKDISTGTAGTVAVVLNLAGLIIILSLTAGSQLFIAILLSEIIAKFSMVLMAVLGKPATNGSSSLFADFMKNKKKIIFAILITIIPLVWLGGFTGILVLGVGASVTIILVLLTKHNFGGITGDILGTSNELTRISSLLIFVSV